MGVETMNTGGWPRRTFRWRLRKYTVYGPSRAMAPSLTPDGVKYTLQDRYIIERQGVESRFSIEAELVDGVADPAQIEREYFCAHCEGMEIFRREHPRPSESEQIMTATELLRRSHEYREGGEE